MELEEALKNLKVINSGTGNHIEAQSVTIDNKSTEMKGPAVDTEFSFSFDDVIIKYPDKRNDNERKVRFNLSLDRPAKILYVKLGKMANGTGSVTGRTPGTAESGPSANVRDDKGGNAITSTNDITTEPSSQAGNSTVEEVSPQ
jgi:hypothetical protein